MRTVENQMFDQERAWYGSEDLVLKGCSFDGPADGESACKECKNIIVEDCFCNLRYPFWHVHGLQIANSEMTENCRASLWYSDHIQIKNTQMYGIKALRECEQVNLEHCDILSPEFGWSTKDIEMRDCKVQSEYFMMRSENIRFDHVDMTGKYSFQYIQDATFDHCTFDTKDAFWHGHNVTVKNSVIKGEYLAWYSDGLTLIDCKIIGTQPLCYCKNLKLINCEMIDTDLAFERSDVEATITTNVMSIKNPKSGKIIVPSVDEIIRDEEWAKGAVLIK